MSLRPQAKTRELGGPESFLISRPSKDAEIPHLTPREREVMHWLSEGKRDREIAIILGLSPRTVEKHVCHILEKLQVETRTAAVSEFHYSSGQAPPPAKGRRRYSQQ